MVIQKVLAIDKKLCNGCKACEVACEQEHMLQAGLGFIKVAQKIPEEIGGKLRTEFMPSMCMHCEKPPCVSACTLNAIRKREDGILLIEEERCNGCRQCVDACPLRAIQFLSDRNLAVKCDLCVNRVDSGMLPACVERCPTEAIKLESTRYRILTKAINGLKKSYRLPLRTILE